MKPYGRNLCIKGHTDWKLNYPGLKRIKNWWEDLNTIECRTTMKLNIKRDIECILNDEVNVEVSVEYIDYVDEGNIYEDVYPVQ